MRHRSLILIVSAFALLLAACGGGTVETTVDAPGEFACNPTGDAPAQFDMPEQVIREGHDYVATITMESGEEIVIDLFPEAAPVTTNNFVFLACEGFYDGVTFHRVLPGFVAQGGDPTGTGQGGPGYVIEHEADNDIPFDRPGLLSMAHRMQPRTTGSQFFITYAPVPQLDAQFTVFGEVTEGMDVVEAITPRDPQANPNAPPGDMIEAIRVEER